VRPAFSMTTGFFLRHALRDLGEGRGRPSGPRIAWR
jgi:hypothetical protein